MTMDVTGYTSPRKIIINAFFCLFPLSERRTATECEDTGAVHRKQEQKRGRRKDIELHGLNMRLLSSLDAYSLHASIRSAVCSVALQEEACGSMRDARPEVFSDHLCWCEITSCVS